MPATEQTWRNIKVLHVVFGASALLMLATTIWMLAADHNRQWKGYQTTFREIESRTTMSRLSEANTVKFDQETKAIEEKIEEARNTVPNAAPVDQFAVEMLVFLATQEAPPTDANAEKNPQREQIAAEYRQLKSQPTLKADPELRAKLLAELKKIVPPSSQTPVDNILVAYDQLAKTEPGDARKNARDELLKQMRSAAARAKFREDVLAVENKTRRAEFDKERATYELAVGENRSADDLAKLESNAKIAENRVTLATAKLQAQVTYRLELESLLREVTAAEDTARKALDNHELDLKQFKKTLYSQSDTVGKNVLEGPVLDAFNSPLKPDQIWLPKLTLNNNFRDVARFDRCTTCHLAIDKTLPGSAVLPGYEHAHLLTLDLKVPETPANSLVTMMAMKLAAPNLESPDPRTTEFVYGLQLADKGVLDPRDVTVNVAWSGEPAAQAGLMSGDVIVHINDARVLTRAFAVDYLLNVAHPGDTLHLEVRRGLPHPYSSHPRLDLYVGTSPHPKQAFGCTICHQGQGSATSFEFASHSPNTPEQGEEWARDLGWFQNHHWSFPMLPNRFVESSCLKCHHEVVDLDASPHYPEPPAPKLMEGYNLVRQFGCFGCHEINGFDGPTRRVGPDLRAEPNFAAAAAQLTADPGLAQLPQVSTWAQRLVEHPDNDAVRRQLREFLLSDAKSNLPQLSAASDKLESVLKDVEAPGQFRKVGPSLRHIDSKVGFKFLYDWIRNPQDFRPTTRMPRFFGLWEALDQEEIKAGHEPAQRFEPIEIRAAAEYLLANSQPLADLPTPTGVNEQASAERGKALFERRGCLACHQHTDFPQGRATQGPDLSLIGAKLALNPAGAEGGTKWLVNWLRDPKHYNPRTKMPNVFLLPIDELDAKGQKTGKISDPAADVAAYLMASRGTAGKDGAGWTPTNVPGQNPENPEDAAALKAALNELALLDLKEKFPEVRARQILIEGIPESKAVAVRGDEAILIGGKEGLQKRIMQYVGRRTIAKYGCSGCHDIPGFEDAKPIGTALADWGRKDPSRLAFEQIAHFMSHHGQSEDAADDAAPKSAIPYAPSKDMAGHGGDPLGPADDPQPDDQNTKYFLEKLFGHEREGFLWQKLRAPRSYDYKKTENKGYNERLRMPKFPLDNHQVEAIMTFVLGLVAEPPVEQYIAHPDARHKALVDGRKVLDKFNCGGCHTLRMDRWDVEYRAEDFPPAPKNKDAYEFMLPHFGPDVIEKSLKVDRRGLRHATIVGMPARDEKTLKPVQLDSEREPTDEPGDAAFEQVMLWNDVLINGSPRIVSETVAIPIKDRTVHWYPPQGGDLARLLLPTVVQDERKTNPNAKAVEAWGWLPPPLVVEGRKVQPDWLYKFLMDPFPIRPAVVLRMPRFNLSPGRHPRPGRLLRGVGQRGIPLSVRSAHSRRLSN